MVAVQGNQLFAVRGRAIGGAAVSRVADRVASVVMADLVSTPYAADPDLLMDLKLLRPAQRTKNGGYWCPCTQVCTPFAWQKNW